MESSKRKDYRPQKLMPFSSSSSSKLAATAAAADVDDAETDDDLPPPPPPDDDKKRKMAGSSSSSGQAVRKGSGGAGCSTGGVAGRCQVERCGADLSDAKRYHRRHKVCELHAKAAVVLVAGLRQRFCQQCSRFHELSEFDDTKRSCRRRLAGHNERRRKSSSDSQGDGSSRCRHTDQDGRSHPGNPPYNHFQIR